MRVAPEVEELVRELASKLGYMPSAIRNSAIAYGLLIIAGSGRIPESDKEFLELLDLARKAVKVKTRA